MSKLMIAIFVGVGLGFAGASLAQMNSPTTYPTPMSKANYNQAIKDADAQYKTAKQACSSLSGNAKDICLAEAKGKSSIAKAEADADYKHTPTARENARVAHAQANYNVAIEKLFQDWKFGVMPEAQPFAGELDHYLAGRGLR